MCHVSCVMALIAVVGLVDQVHLVFQLVHHMVHILALIIIGALIR